MKASNNQENKKNTHKLLDCPSKTGYLLNLPSQTKNKIDLESNKTVEKHGYLKQKAKIPVIAELLDDRPLLIPESLILSDYLFKDNKKGQLLVSNKKTGSPKDKSVKKCLKCESSANLREIKKIKDLFASLKPFLTLKNCPLLLLSNLKNLSPLAETQVRPTFLCETCCVTICCEQEKSFISAMKRIFKLNLKESVSNNKSVFTSNTQYLIDSSNKTHFKKLEKLFTGRKRAVKRIEIGQKLRKASLTLKEKYYRKAKLVNETKSVLSLLPDKLERVLETTDSNALLKWVNYQIMRFDGLTAKIQGKPYLKDQSSWASQLDIQTMIIQLNELL